MTTEVERMLARAKRFREIGMAPSPLEVPREPSEEPPVEPVAPLETALERLYPEMFDPEVSYGFSLEEIPAMVEQVVSEWATEDPQRFLQDLYTRGTVEDREALLRQLGAGEEDIGAITEQIAEIEVAEADVERMVTDVFPDMTSEELIEFATEDWAGFLDQIRIKGRTQEGQDLLRLMGFEWADIGEIYGVQKKVLDIDGVKKLVTIKPDNSAWDEKGRQIGVYNPVTNEVEPYQYRIGDTWEHFTAGVGDVIVTSGGAAKWLGAEGIGERLTEFGEYLQLQAPPDTLGEFEWSFMYNPRFYATRVTRTLPFSLSLIPAAICGAYAGSAIAGVVGLGTYGIKLFGVTLSAKFITGAITAGVASRVAESALEAGGVYDRALDKGFSELEAKEAANSTFLNNLKLAGVDAAQFAIAFAPTPSRVFTNLITRGLVTTVRVAGRLTIVGLSEAGEEWYQEIIQRQALGEEIAWDPEMKEVVAIGGIMGVGLGSAGEVYSMIRRNTIEKLPTDLKTKFNDDKAGFIKQGLTEKQAELKALDILAETEEGAKIIENVVEEAKIDAMEREIKPKGKVEELAWEQTFEQMREEVTPIEVPAVPEVVPRTLPLEQVSKLETRAPLDLIRKDESVEIERLTKEIQAEGITEPITIRVREDGSQIVWDGLHRLIVAQDLGIENIPVKYIGEVQMLKPKLPEVFMTGEMWGEMPETARAKALAEAGLNRNLASKSWVDLTKYQQEALRGEVVEAPSAKPPALPAVTEEIIGLPPPAEPVMQGVAENTQGIAEITAKEEVRPSRKVFTKMGLWREFYKPVQKAEVLLNEEKQAYTKERKEISKLVGKDMERRALVWDEVNEKGSVVGLTFDEKRAVAKIREWADRWADRKDMPQSKRIKDYIPHLFEEEMLRQIKEENGIDPILSRILDERFAGKIVDPFLKQRLGKEIGLLKDPIAAMEAYDNVALRVIYYAPMLNKINTYMVDPNIPDGSREYLRNYARRMTGELSKADLALNKMIEEFATTLRKMPVVGESLYQHLTRGNSAGMAAYNLTSTLYMLWLGFKPTSAIRNLSQHMLIIAEVGPVHFADGLRLRFTKEGRAALKKSLVLRSRKLAFLPGIDASFAAQWSDKFRETALYLFRLADKQNVSDAFLAGYSEGKALFPDADEQVWIERGDEVAADTQYQYTKMNSMSFAQNAPGRTLSMLTTWSENWLELMAKWVKRTPSQVFLEQERLTGKKTARANWATSYKAILLYMLIVGWGYAVKERTRLKAWEYTGITSVKYLADIAGGDFPALQAPGGAMDTIVGFLTQDERRLNEGLYKLRSTFTPSVLKQLDSVVSGDKDWLTLFFYLEGKNIEIKRLKDKWKKDFKPYEDLTDIIIRAKKYPTLTESQARKKWREENPLVEAKMFVVGQFTTLSTDEARAEVLRLIEKHKIDVELIDGYEKIFGIDTGETLEPFEKRLGNLEKFKIGEEAEYFTMGDYVSEVNKLVKSVGRHKVQTEGSPLTRGILEAQDTFEAYEAIEEGDARTLWRQQFPEGEAWMYLLGKVQSFKNPKSAEVLLGLMKKYDIPPEAIRAFLDDPARYDELFTQKFELEQKWFDQTTEYENFGNTEAPNYIEDTELRKEAREKFKEDNPNWVADMRRIEAIDNDASDEIIEKWAERGKKIDKFGAGSSEAKVWLLDNPDTFKWALEKELLTDDGKDWNAPVLHLNKKWRKQDEEYAGFGDSGAPNYIEDEDKRLEAREQYLKIHPEYNDDRRRRTMHSFDAPEAIIEEYVEYGRVVDEFHSNSAEANLFRLNHPSLSEFGKNKETLDWEAIDRGKEPIWRIDVDYAKEDADYDAILDEYEGKEETAKTEAYLYDKRGKPTEYCLKRYERIAYKKGMPTKYKIAKGNPLNDFVDYSTNPNLKKPEGWEDETGTDLWYEDDWWMMEHPDFYKEVYMNPDYWDDPHERKDYRTVPDRKVFKKYLDYLEEPKGKRRDDYRWGLWQAGKLAFDRWLVLKWGYTPIAEKRLREEFTPSELFWEEVTEREEEFEETLKEIEQKIKELT